MTPEDSRKNAVQGCNRHFARNMSPMWKEIEGFYFLSSCAWKHGNKAIYVALIWMYIEYTTWLLIFFFTRQVLTDKHLNGIAADYIASKGLGLCVTWLSNA